MTIETLHKWGACSTLIYKDFGLSFHLTHSCSTGAQLEEFKRMLKMELEQGHGLDIMGTKFSCEKFSFLMASTNESQKNEQECFRELGFQETPETWNRKNNSYVILFFIPVHEIMKKLRCSNYIESRERTKPVRRDVVTPASTDIGDPVGDMSAFTPEPSPALPRTPRRVRRVTPMAPPESPIEVTITQPVSTADFMAVYLAQSPNLRNRT